MAYEPINDRSDVNKLLETMAAIFRQLCLLILTEDCYDEFFVEFNFLHVACLKAALSKGLGFAIVAGSLLVKVPQILKIVGAKSAEGLSFTGTILELCALLANFSYNFVNGYPFSSYGDGFFLLIQTSIIGALVLHFDGSTQKALGFIITIASAVLFLCFGVPLNMLLALQLANIPIVFCGKMMQAITNYKNGSTGQLSAITLTMLFAGSLARIFTSIQETGDNIIILTYCVSSLANGIVFAQLLYYWNVSKTKKE